MKKIAIDLRILDTPSGKRGIGYFSLNQFQALENLEHPDLEFLYYTTWYGGNNRGLILSQNSRFYDILSSYRPARGIRRLDPLFAKFWRLALNKTKPDLIHLTHLFETNYVEVPKNIPTVITFYDLIPYFDLEKYFGNEKARSWYRYRLAQLNHASKIIAISESVKRDLIKHLKISAEKINVIYGGFDQRFTVLDKSQVRNFLKVKYNLSSNFIMAQPAFAKHKNAEGIFLSFKRFQEKNSTNLKLVVVCKLVPSEESIWDQRLKELGIRDQVILTNFVPDQDLSYFYNGAEVLLYPSFYEGFGLPILEAMACGTPVITSNTSSMPEAGGAAAEYVNPEDPDNIANVLEKVLNNQKLQQQMIKKGFAQIKKFSWEKCASETLKLYAEVLS